MPSKKPTKNSRVIAALAESSDEDVQIIAPPNESAEKPLFHHLDEDDGPATFEDSLPDDGVAFTAADALSPDASEASATATGLEAAPQPLPIAALCPIVAGAAAPSVAVAGDLLNKSPDVALPLPAVSLPTPREPPPGNALPTLPALPSAVVVRLPPPQHSSGTEVLTAPQSSAGSRPRSR